MPCLFDVDDGDFEVAPARTLRGGRAEQVEALEVGEVLEQRVVLAVERREREQHLVEHRLQLAPTRMMCASTDYIIS